jgi:hypothetical protein
MGAWRSRVFYPWKRGVRVTDAEFCADGRRFALHDLANVGWRHGSMQSARKAAVEIIVVETVLVATVLAGAMAVVQPSLVIGVVAVVYVIGAVAACWLGARRWPTPLLLCGDYRGSPTVLFATSDPVEFGKVSRALMRAVERNRELTR